MNPKPYLPAFDGGTYQIPERQQFWNYCAQRELRFQQCAQCGRVRHPPGPVCGACHSMQSKWLLAPVDAFLFSFSVVHHAVDPSLSQVVPYNIAIVGFASLEPTRIVSNVIDVPPHELAIGLPLRLVWRLGADGRMLPLFARRH